MAKKLSNPLDLSRNKESRFYIYTYTDPRNYIIRYVGKGTKGRAWYLSNHHSHCHAWIMQLKSLGLEPIIEILECFSDNNIALDREIELIALYRYYGFDLTNLTDGGGGAVGCVVSQETRDKQSKVRKGRKRGPLTEEHKRNIGKANKGNIVASPSKETLLKRSKSLKGKKRTKEMNEHRAIIFQNLTYKTALIRSDGVFYKSISSAARDMKCSITPIINAIIGHKRYKRTYKGYTFKYTEKYNG